MRGVSTILQISAVYDSVNRTARSAKRSNPDFFARFNGSCLQKDSKRLMASAGERESDGTLRETRFSICPSIQ